MKLIKMKCDNCGATLEVNQDLERIRCSYCGAEILIDDEATKLKRVEDVKLKARQENHAQDMKERQERHEQDIKEQKEKEEKEEILNFKKGKFSKIILIFAILCLVITFVRQFNISSIISIVQAALFLAAWLFGMNIIKEPVKNLHTILAVIGFILIVPFFAFGTFSFKDLPDKINWNDIALREHLPEPTVLKGKISTNRDDYLSLDIMNIKKDDYTKYVEKCKENGFVIDTSSGDTYYHAYNEEGYKLSVSYYEYSKKYSISLDAPDEMKENAWPNNELTNLLPKPESNLGRVETENSEKVIYYAGNTSKEAYDKYVSEVQAKGFNIGYSKSEKLYSGKNSNGIEVTISKEDFNRMRIEIKKTESSSTPSTPSTPTTPSTPSTGLRSDFKNAMDSYEKFMDEYIAFMKKYQNSNGADLSLIQDYAKYTQKYTEMLSSFEKWNSDLNTEEAKYYLEVQTRVNQKLQSIL